jgi:gluconolactonase
MLPDAAAPGLKTAQVLVDNYNGKPFSSLNDVVVHQQSGVVFFTDPDYGVGQSFKSCEQEYAPNALYAWDPHARQVTMIDDEYDKRE